MFTPSKLKHLLQSYTSQKRFVIAYSGGLDSHVLLHAMAQLQDISMTAVHVNHQLNQRADQWAAHCQQMCDVLQIPLFTETVDIQLKPGDSLEEQARLARYAVLKKYVQEDTVLLTAHNMNDQAETFLLQALRGSGLPGLSAMPMVKPFENTKHIRPLLSFTRENLEVYARENLLQWIDDDSNVDTRFDRNFLRHDIFPLLKKRFPAVVGNFARSARLAAEGQRVMTEDIETLYEQIKTDDVKKINLRVLLSFSAVKQRLLLRHWLAQNHLRMPSEIQLQQIQKDVLLASKNADPIFMLGSCAIRRYRSHLYLVFEKELLSCVRRPGSRIKLPGKQYSQSLKKYFQAQGIPPWDRERVALELEDDVFFR